MQEPSVMTNLTLEEQKRQQAAFDAYHAQPVVREFKRLLADRCREEGLRFDLSGMNRALQLLNQLIEDIGGLPDRHGWIVPETP